MTSLSVICLDEHVDGAVNFRDLGGYQAGSARLRAGVVYRSGLTHRISEAGLRTMVERYGIRSVIDLRSNQELADDGTAPFASVGIEHHHTPVFASLDMSVEVREQRIAAMRAGQYDWLTSYVTMTREGKHAFRRFFEVLARPDALPAVFHCTGGRDRTGVAAALLLTVLGVDADTVALDYALTGEHLRPHIHHFTGQAERWQMTREQMAEVLETKAEDMLRFLAQLDQEHGSAEAYLATIGVTAEQIETVRGALLEAA